MSPILTAFPTHVTGRTRGRAATLAKIIIGLLALVLVVWFRAPIADVLHVVGDRTAVSVGSAQHAGADHLARNSSLACLLLVPASRVPVETAVDA